jgi:hypothetical protein
VSENLSGKLCVHGIPVEHKLYACAKCQATASIKYVVDQWIRRMKEKQVAKLEGEK